MITDTRHTPHGENERGPRAHEARMRVRVVVRPGHMGQMLPDARLYASGTHEIEIWASDFSQLQSLLETEEDELATARKVYAKLLAEFIRETRKSEGEFPHSIEACFRQGVRRDLLPVTSIEVLGDVESIRAAAVRLQTEQINAAQPSQGSLAGEIVAALLKLGVVLPAATTSKGKV